MSRGGKIRGAIFVPTGRVIKYPPKCAPPGGPGPPRPPPAGAPRGAPVGGPRYPPRYPPSYHPPVSTNPRSSPLAGDHGTRVWPTLRLTHTMWGPSPPHMERVRAIAPLSVKHPDRLRLVTSGECVDRYTHDVIDKTASQIGHGPLRNSPGHLAVPWVHSRSAPPATSGLTRSYQGPWGTPLRGVPRTPSQGGLQGGPPGGSGTPPGTGPGPPPTAPRELRLATWGPLDPLRPRPPGGPGGPFPGPASGGQKSPIFDPLRCKVVGEWGGSAH